MNFEIRMVCAVGAAICFGIFTDSVVFGFGVFFAGAVIARE